MLKPSADAWFSISVADAVAAAPISVTFALFFAASTPRAFSSSVISCWFWKVYCCWFCYGARACVSYGIRTQKKYNTTKAAPRTRTKDKNHEEPRQGHNNSKITWNMLAASKPTTTTKASTHTHDQESSYCNLNVDHLLLELGIKGDLQHLQMQNLSTSLWRQRWTQRWRGGVDEDDDDDDGDNGGGDGIEDSHSHREMNSKQPASQ